MPVICTGGFQTASVIAAASRGATATRSASRGRSSPTTTWWRCSAAGRTAPSVPCTYCNRCLVNVVENPLGCYEETRFPSREAMIAEIMSVFQPPTVRPDRPTPETATWPDDLISRSWANLPQRTPVVQAAAPARDGRAGRDSQRAARRRTCTTPRSRRSSSRRSRRISIRRCARRGPSTARSTICSYPEDGRRRLPVRPQHAARAHVPGCRESADPQPARWSAAS